MNRPIRVMHVMGHMTGGGVETTVMNHYRNIDRTQVQFDFVIDSDSTVVPREEIQDLGGRIFVVPPYKQLPQYFRACETLFRKQRPDIVHSNINALSAFPLAAAKRAGVTVRIAHSHSTANPKEYKKTLVKNVLRPFSRVMPTNLVACSDQAARWLFGNNAVDTGKVHIVKNAIDLGRFTANREIRERKRNELGVSGNQLVVGHVGRMCYQKNQMFCLDVFAQLLKKYTDAKMIFVGDGEMMQTVKRQAHHLGIKESVVFLGSRNDVNDLYQAFDALLFPSKYEGLPLTLIEAQASRLPIVMSKNISNEVVIVKSISFIMDLADSVRDWTNTLETALELGHSSRKADYKELIENGYAIQESADSLCMWYQQLLEMQKNIPGKN